MYRKKKIVIEKVSEIIEEDMSVRQKNTSICLFLNFITFNTIVFALFKNAYWFFVLFETSLSLLMLFLYESLLPAKLYA